MLLWLTDYLAGYVSGFGVFQYLTFRTMVSTLTAARHLAVGGAGDDSQAVALSDRPSGAPS